MSILSNAVSSRIAEVGFLCLSKFHWPMASASGVLYESTLLKFPNLNPSSQASKS